MPWVADATHAPCTTTEPPEVRDSQSRMTLKTEERTPGVGLPSLAAANIGVRYVQARIELGHIEGHDFRYHLSHCPHALVHSDFASLAAFC